MHLMTMSDSLIYSICKKDIQTMLEETGCLIKDEVSALEDLTRRTDFKEIQEDIDDFVRIFQVSFTEEQTKQMLYRLKHLIVERKKEVIQRFQTSISLGGYNSYYNKMILRAYEDNRVPDLLKETIIHELLHMASTRNTKKGHLTGFELFNEFGRELNEGYTEYLRLKYFNKAPGNIQESTNWRIAIVKGLENIVGAKEMEQYYFSADLYGLVHALSQYAPREDIIKLIFTMDQMEKPIGFSSKKYQFVMKEIARINEKKLQVDVSQGKITRDQYQKQRAIKVEEFRHYRLWTENAEIKEDNDSFVIIEEGCMSPIYFKKPQKNARIIPKTI